MTAFELRRPEPLPTQKAQRALCGVYHKVA
jgi:hypothetical protein